MKRPIQISDQGWQSTQTPNDPMKTARQPVKLADEGWQSLGVLPPQSVRSFKGVNTLDKFSIDPEYAVRVKNLTGAGFPAMKTRPGTTQLGAVLAGRVQGLALWKDEELHVVAGGTWYRMTAGSWSVVRSGLSTTAPMSFCNFKGDLSGISLIGVNGANGAFYYNGSTVQTLSGIPAGVNFIDQHDNRLYAAKENTVSHSALRKTQDWTTLDDSGEFVLETDDGEQVNGLKSGFRHLMVFKPSSFHELWGTGPLNYTLQTISRDIGLLNNNAITTVQGTPYWVDQKAIYSYGGSMPRKDFYLPVREYIEKINPLQYGKVSAGSSGNTFYVSLPYGTATDPDTVLEYDTVFQVWYVWNNLSPLAFCDFNNVLHMGDTGGRVYKLGGTTEYNGSAIEWEWVSPPIGSGTLSQRSVWYRMWYVVDMPAGSSMTIQLSQDAEGENWTTIKAIPAAGRPDTGRIIIPLQQVANANWVRVRLFGTGPVKITEMDYQRREMPMY